MGTGLSTLLSGPSIMVGSIYPSTSLSRESVETVSLGSPHDVLPLIFSSKG